MMNEPPCWWGREISKSIIPRAYVDLCLDDDVIYLFVSDCTETVWCVSLFSRRTGHVKLLIYVPMKEHTEEAHNASLSLLSADTIYENARTQLQLYSRVCQEHEFWEENVSVPSLIVRVEDLSAKMARCIGNAYGSCEERD